MDPQEPENINTETEQAEDAAPAQRRQRNRSRGWFLTLNNHTEQETTALLDCCAADGASYVVQEERGEEGTPHLQGYIHFKNQIAFSTIKQWNPRCHWERARSVAHAVAYCSDPTKRVGRIWATGFTVDTRDLRIVLEPNLYDWQKNLLQELRGEPHMRNIIWYCDVEGGTGKTAFARFLLKNIPHTMFVTTGSSKDIAYQVIKSSWNPETVIFNLPRTAEGGMSYGALESLKDGVIFSGKYEGGAKLFPPPHVVVMANFLPDLTKLSMDRWDIRTLLNNPPRLLGTAPMLINGLPPT